MKKKAMPSEIASKKKKLGHLLEEIFAKEELELGERYKKEPQKKKDVIDNFGNSFSIKGGKKTQVFLYSLSRLKKDSLLQAIGGNLGEILSKCLEVLPDSRKEYISNKRYYKQKLASAMKDVHAKLCDKVVLKAFWQMSLFNGNEVEFLVLAKPKSDIDDISSYTFHIFYREDVLRVFEKKIKPDLSKARREGEYEAQKVVFKVTSDSKNISIGEIEVRTDSDVHYRELKCWLYTPLVLELLKKEIKNVVRLKNKRTFLYGNAIKKLKEYIKRFGKNKVKRSIFDFCLRNFW